MNESRLYKRPDLRNHKVLYGGRRYWVIEVSKEYPYRGYEDIAGLVIYDGLYDIDIGWGRKDEKGVFIGGVPYGQHLLEVKGNTVRDFVRSIAKEAEWALRH
jgi:hypothetical protein